MKSIDDAITQLESLQKVLKKGKTTQVQNTDEKSIVKATALSWFNDLRPQILLEDIYLNEIDSSYKMLLKSSDKNVTRNKYLLTIKTTISQLIKLRLEHIVSYSQLSKTSEIVPNFSTLVKDNKMQTIISNRWNECKKCIEADAPLAATVMMGGILETILLAKINSLTDKTAIFKAKSAPIDKKTSKVHPLQEWTLRNYIDVAHELNWISQSTKDVGEVLRDYRNYIHPYKELSHGIKLTKPDSELFWNITKSIISQLLI